MVERATELIKLKKAEMKEIEKGVSELIRKIDKKRNIRKKDRIKEFKKERNINE